jgi:hypothetical protein
MAAVKTIAIYRDFRTEWQTNKPVSERPDRVCLVTLGGAFGIALGLLWDEMSRTGKCFMNGGKNAERCLVTRDQPVPSNNTSASTPITAVTLFRVAILFSRMNLTRPDLMCTDKVGCDWRRAAYGVGHWDC